MSAAGPDFIYFDNNATTFMSKSTKKIICDTLDGGNPSGTYGLAQRSRNIIESTKQYIARHCGFSQSDFNIILTSCASESNNWILRSCVESYTFITKTKPHIVISAIEHKTSLDCATQLELLGYADITRVAPTIQGEITANAVAAAIMPRTCIVSVMSANNETGIINDIAAIGAVCHGRGIPLHVDAVQTFGKYLFNPNSANTDAFSVSFHKLYGPTGIGAIVVRRNLIKNYGLSAMICGSQNGGMRGGTESTFLVAGALSGMVETFTNRDEKNANLVALKNAWLGGLAASYAVVAWQAGLVDAVNPQLVTTLMRPGMVNVVVFGGNTLINTVLMSIVIVKATGLIVNICNLKLQSLLNACGLIVSLGSACSMGAASHVTAAMRVPNTIRSSVIRISFGDTNTADEVRRALIILEHTIRFESVKLLTDVK